MNTSGEAYRYIVEKGLLKKQQLLAYKVVALYGPATESELRQSYKSYGLNGQFPMGDVEFLHKRLPELRKAGVLASAITKKCKVTGRYCMVWSITNRLPEKVAEQRPMFTSKLCGSCGGSGKVQVPVETVA